MAKIQRREFAKKAAAAALAVPLLREKFARDRVAQQPAESPKSEPKPKLTADQETAVRKAVERRDQQLKKMRGLVLPYDLEPAFIFAARPKPRGIRRD